MTNCKKCLFYNVDEDEMRRSGQDVIVDGKEPPDDHFCFAFTPIPDGYFSGARDCPKYLPRED